MMTNQQRIIQFIGNYQRTHSGKSPTVREITAALGVRSTGTVSWHLDRLRRKGMIARDGRAITILSDKPVTEIPGKPPHSDFCQKTERVYGFIIQFKRDSGGVSPTFKEIANGVGISSTNTVRYHLDRLEADGRIVTDPDGRARHISIPGEVWYLPAVGVGGS